MGYGNDRNFPLSTYTIPQLLSIGRIAEFGRSRSRKSLRARTCVRYFLSICIFSDYITYFAAPKFSAITVPFDWCVLARELYMIHCSKII